MQKNRNNKETEVQTTKTTQTYKAVLYARISREDGDKMESDSIGSQRELIKEYIKNKPEINLVSERVDDGYTGVTFERPALNAMLDDVKSGKINCIVVKDLSRFGRNYIEVGRYIGTLFPLLGVRFIAVNDSYDSADEKNQANDYIIPFKNIINDAYCADISKKTRSQLEIKRKKGDFISPFVPFGYVRSPENKNRLVIDESAAAVVQDIYKWKLSGMSQQGIADKLNSLGVLSPLEYKKSMGLGCSSAFKVNMKAKWSAVAVKRILCDEVYTGVLLQGKTTTPNYKIKRLTVKDKSEWVRVDDAHEAIITKEEFELVADLLLRDVRNAPSKKTVYPFSGVLFCSKCGHNLVRKVSTVDGVKYVNHACLKIHKNDKRAGCAGIRIKDDALFEIVTCAVRNHIKSILDMERTLEVIDDIPQKQAEIQKLQNQIEEKKAESEKLENRKVRLYEDYTDGEITRDEYDSFRKNYDSQIAEVETALDNLKKELDGVTETTGQLNEKWLEYIAELCSAEEYRDLTEQSSVFELTRELIVKLIYKIVIYESGRLEIIFRYKDDFENDVNMNAPGNVKGVR